MSSNSKIKCVRIVLALLLLAATVIFIWHNSLQDPATSQARSLKALEKIAPYLEKIIGKGNVTDHLIRKLGHFTEFFALGCELILITIILGKVKFQSVINCLSASLAVAVTDEALQIISHRGSQVSDVVLDFCGAFTGAMFILFIYLIIRAMTSSKYDTAKY